MRRYVLRSRWKRGLVRAADALGEAWKGRRPPGCRRPPGREPERVLVVRLDQIGDVLFTTPLFGALKSLLPRAHVTALAGPWGEPVLRGNPHVDELWVHDSPWHRRGGGGGGRWRGGGLFSLFLRIRRGRFDLALDPRGDFRHILLLKAAGVRFLAGLGHTGGGPLLDAELPPQEGVHQVEQNLMLLDLLGLGPARRSEPAIYLAEEEVARGREFLRARGLLDGGPPAGLHAGGGYETKRWGGDRFAEVLRLLLASYPFRVALFGGREERALHAAIREAALRGGAARERVVNLAGEVDLRGYMSLLPHFSLFIGGDSAPGHIAAALGVPFVGVFGGTNRLSEWAPRGRAEVVRHEVPCSPCNLKSCWHLSCLDGVGVGEVLGAIRRCASA